jgi:putative ABC transport system permease protein
MLGVALGFAVHVINQSALDEFSRAVRSVNGQPDLQLHAMQGGLPLALYPRWRRPGRRQRRALGRNHGVAARQQRRSADARHARSGARRELARARQRCPQAGPVAPALMPRLFEGGNRLDLFAPDAVFLNAAALQALRLSPEQAVNAPMQWLLNGQAQQLRIAGTVAASGAPVAVMDIAALQQKLGLFERIDRLDLC